MKRRFIQISILTALIFSGALEADAAVEEKLTAPKFEKKTIQLGDTELTVEIADTDEKRAYGLMNRLSMSDKEGMLFIFGEERSVSFWMKNTLIPLNIGFFDKSRHLVDEQEMSVPSALEINPPTYPSKKPALYALEVNKGWFHKNHIKLGIEFNYKNGEPVNSGKKPK